MWERGRARFSQFRAGFSIAKACEGVLNAECVQGRGLTRGGGACGRFISECDRFVVENRAEIDIHPATSGHEPVTLLENGVRDRVCGGVCDGVSGGMGSDLLICAIACNLVKLHQASGAGDSADMKYCPLSSVGRAFPW